MRAAALTWCVAFVGACSGPSGPAYVRRHVDAVDTAPCLFWANRTVTYHVDAPSSAEHAAVDAAFAAWQAVATACSDLQLVAGTAVTDENLVVWREKSCSTVVPANDPCLSAETCESIYDCWDYEKVTLALTTVTYSRSTGTLLDADVQLNAADWVLTTVDSPICPKEAPAAGCVAVDVRNTLTHEIGHVLGFDHAASSASTMSSIAPPGDLTKRVIDSGTVEGLCAVYPRGAASPLCE